MSRIEMTTEAFTAENLDCMSIDELQRYSDTTNAQAKRTSARAGHLIALSEALTTLSHYATIKRNAMRYREAGHIAYALRLEANCEAIYNSLPAFARW